MSKCEKFGYGFMMTHVAATAPGMVALQAAGELTGHTLKYKRKLNAKQCRYYRKQSVHNIMFENLLVSK